MSISSSISGGGGGSGGGSGTIGGSSGATDNALIRANGTGGTTIQSSAVTVDDTGNVSLPSRLYGKQGADIAASGQDLTLGNGNYFVITGTGTISSISTSQWSIGSVVILQFSANVTVEHDSGVASFDPLMLAGSVNFSATAGDTLTLVFDGSGWRETSRTVI